MRALSPPADRLRPARRAAAQVTSEGVTSSLLTKRGDIERGNDAQFQARYNEWQGWARRYFRSITAASFNAMVIADMCGRCELQIEERVGREWEPTEDVRFDGLLDLYRNPLQGPNELVRMHAHHYQVAGEMVGTMLDGERGREFGIYSMSVCEWDKPEPDYVTIKLVPDGKVDKGTAFILPTSHAVRFWNPDHEWFLYPWSPMAASINDLKRYDALAKHALKTADSAVAMSGFIWGPGEPHAEEPTGTDDADADDIGTPRSKLEELYYGIASMRQSASEDVTSIAPPFLHWDKEWGPPSWIKLGEPLDPNGIAYRAEALEDFARGQPMPSTAIIGGGVGDANHWSEWLASAKTFDSGVAPWMDKITHRDLTDWFLLPILLLSGIEPEQAANYRIGYDPTPVIVKPDNSANALALWRAGLLDDVPALEACGFSDSDLLVNPETRTWLLNILSNGQAGATGGAPQPVDGSNVVQAPPSTNGTPVAAAVTRSRVASVISDALRLVDAEH